MKVGSRVRGVGFPKKEYDKYNPHDLEGTIVSLDGEFSPIIVEWDNKIRNSYVEKNLEVIYD